MEKSNICGFMWDVTTYPWNFNFSKTIVEGRVWMKNYIRQFYVDHYTDVIMGTITYQITSLTIVYSTAYSDADLRKYQSSASLACMREIHRRPANSPHKWSVTRNMLPFVDVIMFDFLSIPLTQLICVNERNPCSETISLWLVSS